MWLKVEENEKQEIVVELMNEHEVYKMQSGSSQILVQSLIFYMNI